MQKKEKLKTLLKLEKRLKQLGVVAHACNPCTWEVEAWGLFEPTLG